MVSLICFNIFSKGDEETVIPELSLQHYCEVWNVDDTTCGQICINCSKGEFFLNFRIIKCINLNMIFLIAINSHDQLWRNLD